MRKIIVPKNSLLLLTGLALVLAAANCGKKEDPNSDSEGGGLPVKPRLLKFPEQKAAPSLRLDDTLPSPDAAYAQSFTPTSLKISLTRIELMQGDKDNMSSVGAATIYQCPAKTISGCMIEVGQLKALTDALNAKPIEVRPGKYTKLRVFTCAGSPDIPEKKQVIELAGSAVVNGKTYVTDTKLGAKEGKASTATPVKFEFEGCIGVTMLDKPIEVTAKPTPIPTSSPEPDSKDKGGEEIALPLNLLFDAQDFAILGVGSMNEKTASLAVSMPDGKTKATSELCKGDYKGLWVCTGRTVILPTEDRAPVIERYRIGFSDTKKDSFGNVGSVTEPGSTAILGLMLKSNGTPLFAYQRRSMDSGVRYNQAMPGDGTFSEVSKTSSGAVNIKTVPGGGNMTFYDLFKGFKRESHEGTDFAEIANGKVVERPYFAEKLGAQ